jgi:two-component sensor histidine kinase
VLLQYSDDLLFREAAALHVLVLSMGQNELQSGLDRRATSEATDDDFTIKWIERGAPEIVTKPEHERIGFGSKLVERSISQHLGGSIHCDWSREGAVVTLTRLAR